MEKAKQVAAQIDPQSVALIYLNSFLALNQTNEQNVILSDVLKPLATSLAKLTQVQEDLCQCLKNDYFYLIFMMLIGECYNEKLHDHTRALK